MAQRDKDLEPTPPLFDLPSPEESPPAQKEPAIFEEFSWYWSLTSKGKINRRVVLGLLAGFLGGLTLLFSKGIKGIAEAQTKDNRVATALFSEGVLTVTRTDGNVKRLAGHGSLPLFEGDKLQTGRVSQGYLIFKEGSRMALNTNTTLVIRSRKDDKGTLQVIGLVVGGMWAKIAKKTKRFEVETPNALAAVSGTEFGLSVTFGSVDSTLTVGEGNMEFTSKLPPDIALHEKMRAVPWDKIEKLLKDKGVDEQEFNLLGPIKELVKAIIEEKIESFAVLADLGVYHEIMLHMLLNWWRQADREGFDKLFHRVWVRAGQQSRVHNYEPPLDPYLVNVDSILNWGRSLNDRFGPKGIGVDESGDRSPRGLPRERKSPKDTSSSPSSPY